MKASQERPTAPEIKSPQTLTELTVALCRIIRIQTDVIDSLYLMLLQYVTWEDIPAETWNRMQEAALLCREILQAGGDSRDVG